MPGQRSTELPEQVWTGPFGGIQSEMASSQIGTSGFFDLQDVLLYKGQIGPRPSVTILPQPSTNYVTGVFDFFNYQGNRFSGIFTTTSMFQWIPNTQSWTQITGTLTNSPNLMAWTVVAGKLLFSQGVDPVQVWDGISASFSTVSPNAVPAFHLGELDNHLVGTPTVEAGSLAPQRVRWTGAGDPTDWTSFNAGQEDLFNDLGPIRGWRKIYQSGYIFQTWGIVQQVITGNGLVPFDFIPLQSKSKGCYYSWSLAGYGEKVAVYLGKDNVYMFDGSSSEPIGDMPMSSGLRAGARTRIFADVLACTSPDNCYGFITTSSNLTIFESYWLVIPGISTWIFNLLEGSWTRHVYGFDSPTVVGDLFNPHLLRIIDLVGPIASQHFSISQLSGLNNSLDSIALGGVAGNVGLLDFSGFSGVTPTSWHIATGNFTFDDKRHSKNLRRVRLVYFAPAGAVFSVSLTNENNQSETHTVTITGSNSEQIQLVPFQIPGFFLQMVITGITGNQILFSEIAFGYDTGAEVAVTNTVV